MNQSFARVCDIRFTCGAITSMFWLSFGKIQWMDQKLWTKKCHFLAYLGHFGVFLTLLSPWGRNESFLKIGWILRSQFWLKSGDQYIKQNFSKSNGRLSGNKPDIQTHRTDYYSPFPTKFGEIKKSEELWNGSKLKRKSHFWYISEHSLTSFEPAGTRTVLSEGILQCTHMIPKIRKNKSCVHGPPLCSVSESVGWV